MIRARFVALRTRASLMPNPAAVPRRGWAFGPGDPGRRVIQTNRDLDHPPHSPVGAAERAARGSAAASHPPAGIRVPIVTESNALSPVLRNPRHPWLAC